MISAVTYPIARLVKDCRASGSLSSPNLLALTALLLKSSKRTILLADPGRGGLTPYPPYLPGMMLIASILLPLKFIDTPTGQAASRHYTPLTAGIASAGVSGKRRV
jgi:hypothetical protein